MPEAKTIPVEKIRPSPFQPREEFDKEKIKELAESVRGSGLVEPILVRKKGETYQIVAGERRWRACQFAEKDEMLAIVRDVDDIESRELSLIENWHRMNLETNQAENFIVNLYKDGTSEGRYKGVNDMSKRTGIPQSTLSEIISSAGVRKDLGLSSTITYPDIKRTTPLEDKPELRKKLLERRAEKEIPADELREYSKTIRGSSKPIRRELLRKGSKITPEEAKTIDTELTEHRQKERAIERLAEEKSEDRARSIVEVVKLTEEIKKRELEKVEIDTGDVWVCPTCEKKFRLMHVDPEGRHRYREVEE